MAAISTQAAQAAANSFEGATGTITVLKHLPPARELHEILKCKTIGWDPSGEPTLTFDQWMLKDVENFDRLRETKPGCDCVCYCNLRSPKTGTNVRVGFRIHRVNDLALSCSGLARCVLPDCTAPCWSPDYRGSDFDRCHAHAEAAPAPKHAAAAPKAQPVRAPCIKCGSKDAEIERLKADLKRVQDQNESLKRDLAKAQESINALQDLVQPEDPSGGGDEFKMREGPEPGYAASHRLAVKLSKQDERKARQEREDAAIAKALSEETAPAVMAEPFAPAPDALVSDPFVSDPFVVATPVPAAGLSVVSRQHAPKVTVNRCYQADITVTTRKYRNDGSLREETTVVDRSKSVVRGRASGDLASIVNQVMALESQRGFKPKYRRIKDLKTAISDDLSKGIVQEPEAYLLKDEAAI